MSLWSRISQALSALASGEPLSSVFEQFRTPPERSVAFTIAIIALGAKMAKADGVVTTGEVSAFRSIFQIPPEEEGNAARVFNLARQDVAGFEAYAAKIAKMFNGERETLIDILEGLFHIAVADDHFHEAEDAFLRQVALEFQLTEACYRGVKARFVPNQPQDPYEVLDVSPDAPLEKVRAAWRQAVKEHHPDRLQARGVPAEALRLAQERLVALNLAWEEISRMRSPQSITLE